MVGKYVKRPVEIMAVQFTGDNGQEIADFMQCQRPWIEDGVLKISTLAGVMNASPGEWIIRGVEGEFYPCKPDIFERTYRPAGQADTLQRLEEWVNGHKARRVTIERDDGYGATCWTVALDGRGKKRVRASECAFFRLPNPVPEDIVVVAGEDMEDWPGVEATINAALDRAEKLGL